MLKVKDFVEGLKFFKRNRVPLEAKVFSIAIYIQTSSVRRTARTLLEFYPVSKTSVWNWIVFREIAKYDREKIKEPSSIG